MFLVLSMTFGFVAASANHFPSVNVKLTWGGDMNVMNGDPMGSVLLTRGNMASVILRGLEPDKYYSLRHDSECLDLGAKTNRNGNLRTKKLEWDYTGLLDGKWLASGEAMEFELTEFQCSATTGDVVLKGVEPKNKVRTWFP